MCLLLIFDICGHAAMGRILDGFHLNYVEDLCEVSFSEDGKEHHDWKNGKPDSFFQSRSTSLSHTQTHTIFVLGIGVFVLHHFIFQETASDKSFIPHPVIFNPEGFFSAALSWPISMLPSPFPYHTTAQCAAGKILGFDHFITILEKIAAFSHVPMKSLLSVRLK